MSKEKRGVERATVRSHAGEPWVELDDGRALAGWGKDEEIAYNQAQRQTEKYRMFVRAFDFIAENRIEGDYHEFGCHRGRTFRMALTEARRHNLDAMTFFAFDSFEGLPEVRTGPSVAGWRKGAIATSEADFRALIEAHGIYPERVVTVKGFYEETLTPALAEEFRRERRPIAMATVDCDLYESAVPVFRFIEPLLQEGSLLYLDDLFTGYRGSPLKGVARAFREFRAQSRFKFVRHMDVGWWGRTYIAYLGEDELKTEL